MGDVLADKKRESSLDLSMIAIATSLKKLLMTVVGVKLRRCSGQSAGGPKWTLDLSIELRSPFRGTLLPSHGRFMFGSRLSRAIRTVSQHQKGLTHRTRGFSGRSLIRINPNTAEEPEWRLQTLAIETSCDDTSVAVLSISASGPKDDLKLRSKVLFHEKVTADSTAYKGIHPIVALGSHQRNLGPLVAEASQALGRNSDGFSTLPQKSHPDAITVTRGPGMRSNLSVGLDLAKGLALAWKVPLVGVHHMQAHALTPRLCWTLRAANDPAKILHRTPLCSKENRTVGWRPYDLEPRFPFLSVLVSGGHTMLIESRDLTDHKVLAETADIALGDCLDKAARAILPVSELKMPYGKGLEDFAFPDGSASYNYAPPLLRGDELQRRETRWDWSLGPPLAESKGGEKSSRRMIYSFAGILSSIQRLMSGDEGAARSLDERCDLARELQRVAFEHLASRIFLHLTTLSSVQRAGISSIVVSGGVASNGFLRHVIRSILDIRGFGHIRLEFPPPALCTDNALMIAWAGMEMFDAGYESELGIQAIRKWSMDPDAEDGGILGAEGWRRR